MKIKISKLDTLFSKYIRTKARWACERCFKQYPPPTNALHCAHIFSRSNFATRFDDDNCKALCYGCHSFLDRNPLLKYDWYIKKYGQGKFNVIELKHRFVAKRSKLEIQALELWLKQRLVDLVENSNVNER